MIANDDLLLGIQKLAAQETSITAVRVSLFLLGALAAFAWAKRRPLLALLAVSIGGFLGLSCWLVQIASPLGLSTDPMMTSAWAQAGVNAFAEPKGPGYVLGSEPDISLVSQLAAFGVPLRVVVLVPQLAAVVAFGLLVWLPFAFLRNRATAAFAASLVLGGGLWPGVSPYGSILLHPSALLVATALFAVLLVSAHKRTVRRTFHRVRLGIWAGLIGAATLVRALQGGTEAGVIAGLLLGVAAIILASPLRAVLRGASSSPSGARRLEAVLLLCVFGGSGLLWWDPPRSVAGFMEARDRHAALRGPMDWIRKNVPKDRIVVASPFYSAPLAAFAGRRVLFSPAATEAEALLSLGEQPRREHLLDSARLGQPLARMAEAFSVTHFFLGPGEPNPPAEAATAPGDEPRMSLVLVYRDVEDFRVFRLEKK